MSAPDGSNLILLPNSGWHNLGAGPLKICKDSLGDVTFYVSAAAPPTGAHGAWLHAEEVINSDSNIWVKSISSTSVEIFFFQLLNDYVGGSGTGGGTSSDTYDDGIGMLMTFAGGM